MTARIRSYAILIAAGAFVASTKPASAQTTPTFNREVVRIFQANCQVCHHSGDVGGFSLMTYASARPWARSIKDQVLQKTMPPWKPTQGADVFQGARALSQHDIDTLAAWADASAPEGDAADLDRKSVV